VLSAHRDDHRFARFEQNGRQCNREDDADHYKRRGYDRNRTNNANNSPAPKRAKIAEHDPNNTDNSNAPKRAKIAPADMNISVPIPELVNTLFDLGTIEPGGRITTSHAVAMIGLYLFQLATEILASRGSTGSSVMEGVTLYSAIKARYIQGDDTAFLAVLRNIQAYGRKLGNTIRQPHGQDYRCIAFKFVKAICDRVTSPMSQAEETFKTDIVKKLKTISSGGKAYKKKMEDLAEVEGLSFKNSIDKLFPIPRTASSMMSMQSFDAFVEFAVGIITATEDA
jgi:hypothetical protein